VILKAKQGRNQKGFCFISDGESDFNIGTYEIRYKEKKILADIRKSPQVPTGLVILDDRVYSWLGCEDSTDVGLSDSSFDVPSCRKLELSLSSTRKLDSKTIADAISKRINDLQDDLDGLILQKSHQIIVERLGIQFAVNSLAPIGNTCYACRIVWSDLESIHLIPVVGIPAYNLVCVIEVGAAAQIEDVMQTISDGVSKAVPRYQLSLEALDQIMSAYSGYGSGSQFSGMIYSDEVVPYSMFDPQTGQPIETSQLFSKSLIASFSEWVLSQIPVHRNKPSNPGQALAVALQRGISFEESHEHPTIILFLSSGVHSHGPNPVKIVKNSWDSHEFPVCCISIGASSNADVLEAISTLTNGWTVKIETMNHLAKLNDKLAQCLYNRS
jgi:hypothetical protein